MSYEDPHRHDLAKVQLFVEAPRSDEHRYTSAFRRNEEALQAVKRCRSPEKSSYQPHTRVENLACSIV